MSVGDRQVSRFDRGETDGYPTGLTLLSGAIAAVVLSPIVWIVMRVLQVDTDYALSIVARPMTVEILLTSLGLVAAVTGASICIGVPLAFLTVRTDLPFRRFWTIAVALPLVIPSYLQGVYLHLRVRPRRTTRKRTRAPRHRVDSTGLRVLGHDARAHAVHLSVRVHHDSGVAAVFRPATRRGRTDARDDTLASIQARNASTTPAGIASGSLLVALYTLSDFGTPSLMRLDVFTRVIFVEYNAFGRETAAMLSPCSCWRSPQ